MCLGTGSYVAGSRVEELLSRVLVDELSVMNTPPPPIDIVLIRLVHHYNRLLKIPPFTNYVLVFHINSIMSLR